MSILKVAALVVVSSTTIHTVAVGPPDQRGRNDLLRISPGVQVTPKQEAIAVYLARLRAELDLVPKLDATEFNDSASRIGAALTLVQRWATLVDQGSCLDLPREQEAKRQAFRRMVARKQVEILPVLRDAYGPAMRRQLWEIDGSARTFGAGFRTIEITNGALAVKRNIDAAHETMRRILLMLRFTRAEYKWSKGAHGYSSTPLKPPRDDAVVIWTEDDAWRLVN